MSSDINSEDAVAPRPNHLSVRNLGEPIRLSKVEPLGGVTAEAAKDGQLVRIFTQLAVTSDQPLFHNIIDGLDQVITHLAQQEGTFVRLSRIGTTLLVIKPNKTAELWLDTAAVAMQCRIRRSLPAGHALFKNDIADITGMSFPCVDIDPGDQVVCIFREAWTYGLAFDFNPDGQLDLARFTKALGTLYREIHYRHLYNAMRDKEFFDRLISHGWFPFAEIINSEFPELMQQCEADFDLSEASEKIVSSFDETRLQHILERWKAKPHFAARASVLQEAVEAFSRKKPISVIKILLTEIEGILNDAYKAKNNGQGAKLQALLAFAEESAISIAGSASTLLLPSAFGKYLKVRTFANFDPVAETGAADSRHAVSHGAAGENTYTMERALQAILTLDQFAFYT